MHLCTYLNCLYVLGIRVGFCDGLGSLYYPDDDAESAIESLALINTLTHLETHEALFKHIKSDHIFRIDQ